MQHILEHLGYSRSESLVYITLLTSGPQSAGKIANNSKLSRVAVYDALRKLTRNALVNQTFNKSISVFIAAHPKRIKFLLQEKQEQTKKDENLLEKMFTLFNKTPQDTKTKVYYGFSGLKTYYEEFLEHAQDEWLVLGVPKRAELLGGFLKDLSERRANKKVKLRIIFNKNAKELIQVRKKQPLSQIRILPDNDITPASIDVLSDRIGIAIYGIEPIVFSLLNKDVAQSFRNYFNIIWKKSKAI